MNGKHEKRAADIVTYMPNSEVKLEASQASMSRDFSCNLHVKTTCKSLLLCWPNELYTVHRCSCLVSMNGQ